MGHLSRDLDQRCNSAECPFKVLVPVRPEGEAGQSFRIRTGAPTQNSRGRKLRLGQWVREGSAPSAEAFLEPPRAPVRPSAGQIWTHSI